jgi:hypothetical protein
MPVVFAQTEDGALPIAALGRHAELHFGLSISVSRPELPPEPPATTSVLLEVQSPDATGSFAVRVRPVLPEDVRAAMAAEQRGKAAGMGDLAARCKTLWVVTADSVTAPWLTWECCALLAFAALGPVLPDDHSTLFGVRSARALALRLRTHSPP